MNDITKTILIGYIHKIFLVYLKKSLYQSSKFYLFIFSEQIISSLRNPSQIHTRRRTAHFLLGQPSDLPTNMLPLEVEVFNKYQKIKEENPTTLLRKFQRDSQKKLLISGKKR